MKKLFYLGLVFVLTFILILLVTEYRVRGDASGNPTLVRVDYLVVVEEWYPSVDTQDNVKTGSVALVDDVTNETTMVTLYQNEYFCDSVRCIWWGLFYPIMKHDYWVAGALLDHSSGEFISVALRDDTQYFRWRELFLPMLDTE